MAVLRAALRKVLPPGAPDTPGAWQEALKPTANADGRRTLYLDRTQRRKLLATIVAEAAPFVRGLCLLPLRPGALAALTAGDFDKRTAELTIGRDKTGKPRRIQLPAEAAKLLTAQSKNKLPGAPLFMRANGKAWDFGWAQRTGRHRNANARLCDRWQPSLLPVKSALQGARPLPLRLEVDHKGALRQRVRNVGLIIEQVVDPGAELDIV